MFHKCTVQFSTALRRRMACIVRATGKFILHPCIARPQLAPPALVCCCPAVHYSPPHKVAVSSFWLDHVVLLWSTWKIVQ